MDLKKMFENAIVLKTNSIKQTAYAQQVHTYRK